MITIYHQAGLTLKVYIKGAPYFVLNHCTYCLRKGESVVISNSFIKYEHL